MCDGYAIVSRSPADNTEAMIWSAGKARTVFEDLCDLQRQAQHFLTVLQATRSSPAPALDGSYGALDRSHGADVDHAEDESTAMQMAELILEVHRYVHPSPA